jgi:hypothetical protein
MGEIHQIEGARDRDSFSRLEVDDETQPSTQTHGRNRRKTSQIMRSRIGPKILKNHKNGKHCNTT